MEDHISATLITPAHVVGVEVSPWSIEPGFAIGIALALSVYLLAWRVVATAPARAWPRRRGLAWLAGLLSLAAAYGVESAFLTTVHAFTSNQRLADSPTDGLRSSRAAGDNIIPSPSNSAEIIAQVLPYLEGKLMATALNVPVPDGSTIDMVVQLGATVTAEEVNTMLEAASERMGAGLDVTRDPIVSTDVIGSSSSGIVDALTTTVTGGNMVKIIIWFDNGWGYTARIIEALEGVPA